MAGETKNNRKGQTVKHLNHRIITSGIALPSGASLPGLAGALAGSVLPDLDIPLGIPHRTITHWWLPPAMGMVVLLLLGSDSPLRAFFLWLSAGALLHIAQDSLTTGGVPLLRPFGKRFSFRLTRTGGVLEHLISFAVMAVSGAVLLRHPEIWEGWIGQTRSFSEWIGRDFL